MVKSTAVSCIHPDKYNNSVDRIISKEEEREDPRRDSSIYLRIQWCFHISTRTTVFHTQSSKFPVIPCYSTYRINSSTRILQEILKLQGSSRADHYKASSSNCPRVSKHSTRQNKAPGYPTAQAGFQQFYPVETAFQAAASIHTTPTVAPRCIPTEFYQEK